MQNIPTIKRGSLLLAAGTPLPPSVSLESHLCTSGWHLLKSVTPQEMKELMTQAGWNFFYIATELRTTVWGWNKGGALRKALRRITTRTEAAEYNCLEIKEVDARRFLGLSFVRLTARSRQIQAQTSRVDEREPSFHLVR